MRTRLHFCGLVTRYVTLRYFTRAATGRGGDGARARTRVVYHADIIGAIIISTTSAALPHYYRYYHCDYDLQREINISPMSNNSGRDVQITRAAALIYNTAWSCCNRMSGSAAR